MKSYKKIFIFSLLLAASLLTGKLSYGMRPDGGCEVLSDGLLDPYCEGPGGSGGGGGGTGGGSGGEKYDPLTDNRHVVYTDCDGQEYPDPSGDDIWPKSLPAVHMIHHPKGPFHGCN